MKNKQHDNTAYVAINSSAQALFKVGAIDEAALRKMREKPASRLKAELLATLFNHASQKGWTEVEASKQFGLTVPRTSELLRSQFDRFSLEDLVSMATRAGLCVKLEIEA